jgi:hypothetical protein
VFDFGLTATQTASQPLLDLDEPVEICAFPITARSAHPVIDKPRRHVALFVEREVVLTFPSSRRSLASARAKGAFGSVVPLTLSYGSHAW